ncbi:MAG TPA: carbon-nitrogen hydrolase family protein, partial [Hyphomonadaceae bacterium]|nr:carbon-nitrogen hydrolase family protein [Hyphomonadaceae bacterium]
MIVGRRRMLLGSVSLGLAACTSAPGAKHSSVKLAVAQMASVNGDVVGNLERAKPLVADAARQGADLVVFPEFMPSGYDLSTASWDSGERNIGATTMWLQVMAQRHGLYIGTSFLEARGEDFYNTFALAGPTGDIGFVRKQTPAGAEAFFFRGEDNPHIIETRLGRIGVVICQENYRCFAANLMAEGKPDFILAPHSFPDVSATGGLPSPPGTHVAGWYARRFGVPVAMVNKTGAWSTPVIGGSTATGVFPGQSAIVGADGKTLALLGKEAGCAVAVAPLDQASRIAEPAR